MAEGEKVLIAEHVPDLLGLIDTLLRQLGYKTRAVLMHNRVMEKARRFAPDVMLVDLVPGHSDDVALLDQLRTDPATAGTAVVAMSTAPALLEQVVASYNVTQVLVKPFDLDALEEKTRAAVEGAPLIALLRPTNAPSRPVFGDVASGLMASSREMMIRWVQRVSSSEPYRHLTLRLGETIDHVPILLTAILIALRAGDFRAAIRQHAAIRDKSADHARTRRKQGIPLSGVIKEYQFLREEIWCETAGILAGKAVTTADMLDLVTRIDYALDTIMIVTVGTFEQEAVQE